MTNARTLPEATTRRAALGAIIAAGAAGATLALPAVASTSDASSHHPDAELLALIERAKTADSAATDARQAAREHPDVLEAQARDEVLTERWRELAKRVARTSAKTPEGLLAKFTLIASGYAEDELDGTYDGILASAAVDAQSLANARIGETRS
jgi:hypothetical protein